MKNIPKHLISDSGRLNPGMGTQYRKDYQLRFKRKNMASDGAVEVQEHKGEQRPRRKIIGKVQMRLAETYGESCDNLAGNIFLPGIKMTWLPVPRHDAL